MSFDEHAGAPDATSPTPDTPATPDAPGENLIACNQPERFQVGTTGVMTMAAVPTSSGFAVFTVDEANALRGWAFQWQGTSLVADAQNVALDTGATGTIGGVASGADLVLASVEGVPDVTGTKLYPLDGSLGLRAPATTQPMIAGEVPLAKHASTNDIVMIDDATALVVHRVTPLGAVSGMVQIADVAEDPSSSMMAPAQTGYVASWVTGMPSPNRGRVQLLDANLAVVAGPVTIGTTTFDVIRPRVAWAPGSNTYLVTWFEKTPTDDDDVWFQLFDQSLAPITPATLLATYGYGATVVTDGTGFWVAWLAYTSQPESLLTARIAADGMVTQRQVAGSGGVPVLWDVVTRAGQPVLIWAEAGGSGPDLWLAAMCE
jgi:hypothetical protein